MRSGRDSVRPEIPEPIVPDPVRVDVGLRDAGRRERVADRVDEQVVGALVPVLAERRAPHPDDRDPVADPVTRHRRASSACSLDGRLPLSGAVGPSRSNCGPPARWRRAGTSSRPGRRSAPTAGSTSVSSQRNRPPPSKSSTAATSGGLGVYASRSTVNVATVAGTSAIRSGCIRSTAPQFAQTRAGGRWRSPHCSQRSPVNPNFHVFAAQRRRRRRRGRDRAAAAARGRGSRAT